MQAARALVLGLCVIGAFILAGTTFAAGQKNGRTEGNTQALFPISGDVLRTGEKHPLPLHQAAGPAAPAEDAGRKNDTEDEEDDDDDEWEA